MEAMKTAEPIERAGADAPSAGSSPPPDAAPAMIRLTQLVSRCGALGPLDLDILKGEFITLLGDLRAGPAALIAIASGFEPPRSGAASIEELAAGEAEARRARCALMLPGGGTPALGAARRMVALALSGRRLGRREKAAAIDRAFAEAGLDAALIGPRRCATLTLEERARLGLARALASGAPILLLEDAFAGLEPRARARLRGDLFRIARARGLTVVAATESVEDALAMSDRIALFRNGAIEQIGPPRDLYERPETSFAAEALGPVNALQGVVELVKDGYARVRLGDGSALAARAGRGATIGAPTRICVRPERVSLSPQGPSAQNRLVAEVLEVAYAGEGWRCRLGLAGAADFKVTIRNAFGAPEPQAGQRAVIGFSAEDCRALDEPAAYPV